MFFRRDFPSYDPGISYWISTGNKALIKVMVRFGLAEPYISTFYVRK
jgi:hypothetical protein